MSVPVSGEFKMFDVNDNTTIQGAISRGGAGQSIASVTTFQQLIAASNPDLFDPSQTISSLSDINNAVQYRNYPVQYFTDQLLKRSSNVNQPILAVVQATSTLQYTLTLRGPGSTPYGTNTGGGTNISSTISNARLSNATTISIGTGSGAAGWYSNNVADNLATGSAIYLSQRVMNTDINSHVARYYNGTSFVGSAIDTSIYTTNSFSNGSNGSALIKPASSLSNSYTLNVATSIKRFTFQDSNNLGTYLTQASPMTPQFSQMHQGNVTKGSGSANINLSGKSAVSGYPASDYSGNLLQYKNQYLYITITANQGINGSNSLYLTDGTTSYAGTGSKPSSNVYEIEFNITKVPNRSLTWLASASNEIHITAS